MSALPNDDGARFDHLQNALAGTWSIERELGRGGMGTVYLARDVALDRPVAIKVLHPALAADPEQRERFLREARTGARLSHPHIVPIYAVEAQDDLVYFVMGLVDGENLGDRIRREGPLRGEDAERILREVAWALSYAHAMGIVHRDVTIENILLERQTGRAVLADFGIAAAVDREGADALLGTPSYIAPEVIQGAPATPASDLYALGVTGWTMLAGHTPFMADDTSALLLKHLTEPVPPLLRAAPGTSSRLARALEAAMAKDPAERPDGAEGWLALLAGDADGVMLAEPLRRWVTRWEMVRPFYALGMSVTAMLTIGSMAGGYSAALFYGQYGTLLLAATYAAMTFAVIGTVHLGIELGLLRRLAREGFRHGDLVQTLGRARQAAQRAGHRTASLLGRVVNDVAWLAGLTWLLLSLGLLGLLLPYTPDDRYWMMHGDLIQLVNTISRYCLLTFLSGLGFNFLVPAFHFKPNGLWARLRDGFWGSFLGAGMLKLASLGLGKSSGTEHTLHRPTELVLDLAIEEMWRALPPSAREGTADLPKIARALSTRVAEARELRAALQAPRVRRSAEADALDARLAVRQQRAVIALERLRLVLGKVGGAAAMSGELTAKLHDARALEHELLLELGAHAEVKRLLRQGRAPTTLTPRVTPA
ncbi:MAG: serine/threonine-protein kinase [Gemmatimonadales bacterium]|nr:serine/threonine-protein kinase [Gemmatimonadales bacterium]